jgi:signal transduction histidine kinase
VTAFAVSSFKIGAMRLSRIGTYWWLLVGGIALLTWLGILQYRWIEKASQAERQERRQFLRNALGGIRGELMARLQKPLATLRPDRGLAPGTDLAAFFSSRFQQWQKEGGDPGLLTGIMICWLAPGGTTNCLRMSPGGSAVSEASWPASLDLYRVQLEQRGRLQGSEPPFIPEGNAWGAINAEPVLIFPILESAQPPNLPRNRGERPAAQMRSGPPSSQLRRPVPPDLRGWCFLEINPKSFQNHFAELTVRYLGDAGTDTYKVALVCDQPACVVCQSIKEKWQLTDRPDEALPLFLPPRPGPGAGRPEGAGFGSRPAQGPLPPFPPPDGGRGRFHPDPPSWQLVARQRYGSIEDAVSRSRRQSLAFSSCALLLLLGSGTLLVISTHRARRLARQQMEFVAGVSHELRTPLTVINTTSYNLAQGKVSDERRVQQYGETIQKEVRRLTTQVEQMLSFAGIESGRKLYDLSPVDVAGSVAGALAAYNAVLTAEGWQIERRIEAGLPAVLADAHVLEGLLKNLIENALKYAGTGRWLGITARAVSEQGRPEIQITVADRGPGIKAEDLPHIFEPFYRGRHPSTDPATAGVGLGLSLVQRHMRAMGGRVTVATFAGRGAAFTLHLPAAEPE